MPEKAGIYVFLNKQNDVLYVGKAINLKSRVSSYFIKSAILGEKTKVLVSQVFKIKITIVESELEALLLEAFYIKKFRPKYNIRLSDDKSFVMIKLTIKDKYPSILISRRNDDPKAIYFGPYPNSGAVKLVLKSIRKIYPFQTNPNHPKRICLYNHLGLCPCPPVFDSPELKKEYSRNIRGIKRILNTQSSKILKEFEKVRDLLSNDEKYEEALKIQKKINALKIITEKRHTPFEYDINPNLRIDLRNQELTELQQILSLHLGDGLGTHLGKLQRIECYDISNTQGTHATGSMVVFTQGEIDSSQYRRFKIKKDGIPNDFAMIQEMLTRRFKHNEWKKPELIIIDGGKGQVSSALNALKVYKIKIPLIGLAKREETIVIPRASGVSKVPKVSKALDTRDTYGTRDTQFMEINLPRNSKALHLIMRIRDEAHRFAITYHKNLRSKSSFE